MWGLVAKAAARAKTNVVSDAGVTTSPVVPERPALIRQHLHADVAEVALADRVVRLQRERPAGNHAAFARLLAVGRGGIGVVDRRLAVGLQRDVLAFDADHVRAPLVFLGGR